MPACWTRRGALSQRFMVIGVALLVAILPLLALAILLLDRFGPYGFLVAAAVFVLSMAAFILSGTYSPLSDEGARGSALAGLCELPEGCDQRP